MGNSFVEGEKGEELLHLYVAFGASVRHAARVLADKGMLSQEFADADKASDAFHRRIRLILD